MLHDDYKDWSADDSKHCVRVQMDEEWIYLFTDVSVRIVDCRNYKSDKKHLYGPAYKESKQKWKSFLTDLHSKILKPFYTENFDRLHVLITRAMCKMMEWDVPCERLELPTYVRDFISLENTGKAGEYPTYRKHYLGMELKTGEKIRIYSPSIYGRIVEIS